MNSLFSNKKWVSFFITYIIDSVFFLIFILFSIFTYNLSKDLSYLFLLIIITTYSLLNLLIGCLTLKKKQSYILSCFSIIFGVSYFIYVLYLFFRLYFKFDPGFLTNFINLFIYVKPYFTAIFVFIICKSFSNICSLKKYLTIFAFVSTGLTAIIFTASAGSFLVKPSPRSLYYLDYVKVSLIIISYLGSMFFLRKKHHLINKPGLIPIFILLILVAASEIVMITSNYYFFGVFYYISLVLPLYFLYIIQIQSFIVSYDTLSPTKKSLYKLNSDLMNKAFNFKDKEVKSLQAEVDATNELYQQLFNLAPDAFFICMGSKITYINQATLSLLDTSHKDKVINTNVWSFIHPDSISLVEDLNNKLLTLESDTLIDEIQIITLEGRIKDVRISSTHFEFGGVSHIFSSLHDLSQDKAHQLIQAQLKENVANEKFKVEFFANISHDLKTPINVIYSAAQLQSVCANDGEYDKVGMYNKVIRQNCLRLQKLLNDLLDITKLDANHFKARPKICDIISTVENIIESVTSYMDEKSISIIFDTNVEEKFALTDPDLVERILLNLISNAIKYGKDKGHIWVTLYDEGNHFIISVKDDGMGIASSQLPNIFKRFHKVREQNSLPSQGTGIGLSLVHSIVDILEGDIFCLSEKGKGSEFVVILPMIPCEKDKDYAPPPIATCFGRDSNLDIELSDT